VNDDPKQLRHQAQHCRRLAEAHYDERIQLMLRRIAEEFDQDAAQLDTAQQAS
jgi:hypothetical protein